MIFGKENFHTWRDLSVGFVGNVTPSVTTTDIADGYSINDVLID